ncbi:hypothetical protein [Synechococcus sp. MIT S1220]|uniref:hypothetical protein n=1 Tax=Synechococcus sp. MIT S1220 TaxID=3082549 RepID=UPI0039AFA8AC
MSISGNTCLMLEPFVSVGVVIAVVGDQSWDRFLSMLFIRWCSDVVSPSTPLLQCLSPLMMQTPSEADENNKFCWLR